MKQFKLSDSPIAYYITGKEHAEWVLFLHAAFADHRMFRAQAEYFKDKYHVLLIDMIGHGSSTDAKKGDSIQHMSVWIKEILKAEAIEKIHIVGISLGAVIAQDFANRYPDNIQSLACFGGYDINHFDPHMQKGNQKAQMLMMMKAIFSVKWFAKANKKITAYTLQAQNEFYEMNLQFKKKSFLYLASLGKMINVHQTALPRPYPLLIGCGSHDLPMERAAIEQWKKHEPECRVIIFEEAGHCVNMDAPKAFQEALEHWWEK